MGDGDNPITSLVDAAVSGDEPAWRELVDRYTPLLASVLRRFGLGAAETQDVVQTVCLRVVEHLGSLREPQALPSWLISIAKREALRCVSDWQRSVPYDPLDPSWLPSATEGAEPDAELLRAERHEALLAGLAELSARQREFLILLTADPPLSYAQISERARIPRAASGRPGPGRWAGSGGLSLSRPTWPAGSWPGTRQPAWTVPPSATRMDRETGIWDDAPLG
jgi:RNA polymerase sigma factor (sigma-70 family)